MTRIKDIKNNKTYYITYDANKCGQPIKMWLKEKEQNLLWEDKNLIQIGEHIKYSYNTKGIRTKKETEEGTTEYSLIGSKIMKMEKVTSSGKITMYFTYDQRDELQSVTESNKEYYYIKDITGNIIKIKDEEGNSIVEYKYDAYGKVEKTIIKNNNISKYNPFIYKGYYYDEETELYYCNTRYYSPEIGRWISIDDVGYLDPESINGLNLYCYCMNDSMNYKQRPISSGGSVINSSISSISNGGTYLSGSISSGSVSSNRVNWENGGFQIPIWISSLMSGSDFGVSIAPALRTIYQYIRYPGVKDLNKLYGLDFVPGKLNKVCPGIGYGLLVLNIGLSAYSNFTNDNLTIKQRWISFGVDTAYTLGTFGIGYGVGALVSLIPGVGVFIAPFVSAGVTWFIDWTNEKWGWLDDVKQWFNDL